MSPPIWSDRNGEGIKGSQLSTISVQSIAKGLIEVAQGIYDFYGRTQFGSGPRIEPCFLLVRQYRPRSRSVILESPIYTIPGCLK